MGSEKKVDEYGPMRAVLSGRGEVLLCEECAEADVAEFATRVLETTVDGSPVRRSYCDACASWREKEEGWKRLRDTVDACFFEYARRFGT